MKKYLAFTLLLLGLLVSAQTYAASGIFQTYVVTDVNAGGNFFRAGGLNPDGGTPYNGTNFGTVTSFTLNGGEAKTYKNGISDVFGAEIYYSIAPSGGPHTSFTPINLPFDANLGGGDQKWKQEFAGVDVLAGLAPGDYELQVYWKATSSDGDHFDSNFGANFTGYFTVACPTASCPAGYTCNAGVCETCPAGTYESGGSCVPCPQGYYNPSTGQTVCLPCLAGTYSPSTGAVSCLECPAGTANPFTAQTSCTACASGTYQSNTGSTTCDACGSCDDSDPGTNDVCDPVLGCTNIPTSVVPTLGQWGLIIFGLLLLCTGAIVVWRRQFRLTKVRTRR